MPEELIMRGKTASGTTETLNFSGHTPGYGFQLREFQLFPSTDLAVDFELTACITAGGTALDPQSADFHDEGLIGSIILKGAAATNYDITSVTVINDLFIITQDLLLTTFTTSGGGPANWQCKFKKVKLSSSAEAVANFKQFTIYDE